MWTSPVYDRTASDVAQRLPKGFFNIADWLRIHGNTEQVQAVVNVMLSLSIPVTALTPPTITTIPAVAEINAFIENIERLRAAACLPTATGAVALKYDYKGGNSADAPDFNAVNAWERDLELIRAGLAEAAEQVLTCGTFNCGSPRILQSGWRHWTGYVPEAVDYRRLIRSGATTGAGLTRQNRWRSPVDQRRRVLRCGMSVCGASSTRQSSFRRY
jgi:hypothetical protein